ncbi:MAG: sulfite exporter TauE/SafE family protein [Clostridia bacterium]|nr:sulfite exporter TauE/SafE family protein [Clostridia bacterium]
MDLNWLWFIIAGIVSGVIAGMGMGGGTLLIPILTIFLSVAQGSAQAINLLAFLPCAIFSLIIHIKNKLVNFKIGIPIIITGVLSSIGASLLAVNTKNEVLQILFGVFLLVVGIEQAVSVIVCLVKQKLNKKIKYVPQKVFKQKLK